MDRGSIITRFDNLYGDLVDHEVIKMVLQNCSWNQEAAEKTLKNMVGEIDNRCDSWRKSSTTKSDTSPFFPKGEQEVKDLVTCSPLEKRHTPDNSYNQSNFWHPAIELKTKSKMGRPNKSQLHQSKTLIILRGLPGSGKSTLANFMCTGNGIIHSTDYFFNDKFGNYAFDSSRLGEAHAWNQSQARFSMSRKKTPIIIDNTNTQIWEMQPYADLARNYGYSIKIIEPSTSWKYDPQQLSRKTRHNVPRSKIEAMLERYEKNITVANLCGLLTAEPTALPANISSSREISMKASTSVESSHPIDISSKNNLSPDSCTASSNGSLNNDLRAKSHKKKKKKKMKKKQDEVSEDVSKINHLRLPDPLPDEKPIGETTPLPGNNYSFPGEVADEKNFSKDNPTLWDLCLLEPPNPESVESLSSKPLKEVPVETKDVATQANFSVTGESDVTILSNPLRFVVSMEEVKYAVNQLHVGCITCDVEGESSTKCAGLKTLSAFFPQVSLYDLTEFFVRCNYDIDWTTNLLIDSGYSVVTDDTQGSNVSNDDCPDPNDSLLEDLFATFENDIKGIGKKSVASESSSENKPSRTPSKNCNTTDESDFESFSLSDGITKSYTFDEDLDEQMLLTVDQKFAMKLMETFGVIDNLHGSSCLNDHDRTIVLPMSLCRELHGFWCATASGVFSEEIDKLKTIQTDQQLAQKLQERENGNCLVPEQRTKCAPQNDTENDVPYSLQEIIDLETAFQESEPPTKDTYSSVLKLKKLKKEYHPVKTATVERKFEIMDASHGSEEGSQECSASAVDMTSEKNRTQEISKYRSAAQMHHERRKKCFQVSRDAFIKKQYGAASYYAQQGNEYSRKMKEANQIASEKILEVCREATTNQSSIDLHLLHVPEAIIATKNFLEDKMKYLSLQKKRTLTVHVVTGKGVHSENSRSRLKPTIKNFLRRGGYTFHEDDGNGGAFCVTLKSQ